MRAVFFSFLLLLLSLCISNLSTHRFWHLNFCRTTRTLSVFKTSPYRKSRWPRKINNFFLSAVLLSNAITKITVIINANARKQHTFMHHFCSCLQMHVVRFDRFQAAQCDKLLPVLLLVFSLLFSVFFSINSDRALQVSKKQFPYRKKNS